MKPLRFSALKHMARSPAHCRYAMDSDWDETLAMRIGSGAHALLFDQPVELWTGKVRNGKVWDAFEAEHSGKVILNAKEHAQAEAIADAVGTHELASALLFASDVAIEERIHWTELGLSCAGTPDVRSPRYIVDLKTTKCADPERFVRDATFRSYHAQLAFYLDGVVASGLGTPTEAYIVAVESSPPHPVTVLRLTDNAIDQGRRLCRIWMERVVGCVRDDSWPGYAESVVPFDVDQPFELEGLDDDEPENDTKEALLAAVARGPL